MIRKILFITSLFAVSVASAQTFQFNDDNDVNIGNITHYEYGTVKTLDKIKFHIENLTGTDERFTVKVEWEYVPNANSDLAVCFGLACYSASATASGVQIINGGIGDVIPANGNYTDFKLAPVTWPWVNTVADSTIWNVTIYNETNSADSVASRIIFKFRIMGDTNGDGVIGAGEVAGDADGNGIIDGSELAGDVTGDGVIGDGELLGDLNGDGKIDGAEVWGDANGNGVIDGGEAALAVNEIDVKSIVLSAFPNPATDYLTIKYDLKTGANDIELNVYDVLGQEIVSRSLNVSRGSIKLDLEAINSGVYFYAIKIAGETLRTERFIVR